MICSAIESAKTLGYTSDQIETWKSSFTPNIFASLVENTFALVAHIDPVARNEIVGVANLISGEDKIGEVDLLYVSPSFQRQGIGQGLIRAIETEATRQHLLSLRADASLLAVGSFQKSGFTVETEYTKVHHYVEFRNTWMYKTLGS